MGYSIIITECTCQHGERKNPPPRVAGGSSGGIGRAIQAAAYRQARAVSPAR
jgi:hypothetical protein